MVARVSDPEVGWVAVDNYIVDRLLARDASLDAVLAASAAAGLPDIAVSPPQGKLLSLLVQASGARRVLEVGTLGGYSTIWLAIGVGKGGQVVTLEVDPHYAEVARDNLVAAGVADRVEVIVGAASHTLPTLSGPFDLIFIDADKPSNVLYLREALRLSRPGSVIVVDNVVREGGVLEADSDDPRIQGTRAMFDAIADEPRLSATAIQTVGGKKWDGFVLMIVDGTEG